MGGIGKTSMAKVLFNDIEHLYEYTCFIGNVKNSQKNDMKYSPKKAEKIVIDHMHHMGKRLTKKDGGLYILNGKKLLLVFDDVASGKHIKLLPILIDNIGVHEDSRFLVTSRDSELLGQCLGAVHPMPYLREGDARKLFLAHAIRQEASPSFDEHTDIVMKKRKLFHVHAGRQEDSPSFDELIDLLVKKCDGLALTLEVIGRHLYKKPATIWKEAIRILDRADTIRGFDEKLWSKLLISFDALDLEEKHMFLDCATVFRGERLREAKAAWNITTNGLQETLWQHLLDLSLVKEIPRGDGVLFDGDVLCGMHEQLLSLGRKIASNDAKCGRRIGNWMDGFGYLSAKYCIENDAKNIVAIKLDGYDAALSTDRLDSTRDLNNSDSTRSVHENVRCDGCEMCPIKGPRFKSRVRYNYDLCVGCFTKGGYKISRLDPHSVNIPHIEGNTLCKMRNLRYLRMSGLAIDQTHGATLASTLVSLRMDWVQFSEFPFRPKDHERMALLDISRCPGLRTLPPTIGLLSCLQELSIGWAPHLKTLPDSLGSLRKLAILNLEGCDSLAELPQTIGQLVALEIFSILSCGALSALPKSFGYLPKLKALYIVNCPRLYNLPDTFLELQGLEWLLLWRTHLQSIPNLENLRSLQSLYIDQYAPRIDIPNLSDFSRWKAESETREVDELVMEKVDLVQ